MRPTVAFVSSLFLSTGAFAATSIDTTFGVNGRSVPELGVATSQANAAILQTDGKIVVVGTTPALASPQSAVPDALINHDFLIARFKADGSLDSQFGSNGIVKIDVSSGEDQATAVAQQADGKLVVAGYAAANLNNDFDFAIVRLNADGTLDTSFGTGGKVTANFGYDDPAGSHYPRGSDRAASLLLTADGKITVGGLSNGIAFSSIVARWLPDGSPDLAFGTAGSVGVGPYMG